jgi:spore germination cell wall hydrolase CwlJ-like protein
MIKFIKILFVLLGLLLVGFIGYTAVMYKLDPNKQLVMSKNGITAEVRNKQLECLAKNIYYEAGNQPFEGKAAVAQVTINRAESGKFPSDICQVVYQKNVVYEKVLCQFSWYCETPAHRKPVNPAAYNESMAVAKKVLLEGFRLDGLKNAVYYHADYVSPRWGKEKIATIGRHIFYSDNKAK